MENQLKDVFIAKFHFKNAEELTNYINSLAKFEITFKDECLEDPTSLIYLDKNGTIIFSDTFSGQWVGTQVDIKYLFEKFLKSKSKSSSCFFEVINNQKNKIFNKKIVEKIDIFRGI